MRKSYIIEPEKLTSWKVILVASICLFLVIGIVEVFDAISKDVIENKGLRQITPAIIVIVFFALFKSYLPDIKIEKEPSKKK